MNNMEDIKEVEQELLRVRLTITEKNQEVESLKKSAKAWGSGFGVFGGIALILGFYGRTIDAIVLFIIGLPFLFLGLSKEFKAMKINGEVNSKKKKKKKQLEDKIKQLLYLAKVKGEKEEL